jgi:GT2 family glycosyltransferase
MMMKSGRAEAVHEVWPEDGVRIAVVVATLGRPKNAAALLARLAEQTHPPSLVVLSMESQADAPPIIAYPFRVERIFGPRGATLQRNRGLDLLPPETDVVAFYDDDFVPSRYALAGMAAFFTRHPDIAGAQGLVLADGIKGPGITPEDARRMVDEADAEGPPADFAILRPIHGLYGCNMVYRVASVKGVRFDEALPLYAWLEDLDFGGRISGKLVHTDAFRGVHCGEKRGREKNGLRLGYSQMCNPVYMIRKGTLPWRVGVNLMVRNFIANHARSLRPEAWIDRKGRVAGNWLALFHILGGRIDPRHILEL